MENQDFESLKTIVDRLELELKESKDKIVEMENAIYLLGLENAKMVARIEGNEKLYDENYMIHHRLILDVKKKVDQQDTSKLPSETNKTKTILNQYAAFLQSYADGREVAASKIAKHFHQKKYQQNYILKFIEHDIRFRIRSDERGHKFIRLA